MGDLGDSAAGPRGRPRFLTPAVGVIAALVAVGSGVFAWSAQGSAPTATWSEDSTPEDLGVEPIDGSSICGPDGQETAAETMLERDSGDPAAELAEYAPRRSPVPTFRKVLSVPLDPARDLEFLPGAVDGHVARYRRAEDGPGFDVFAYRFLSRSSAVERLSEILVAETCGTDGTLYSGRRGTLYWDPPAGSGPALSWSLHHGDVVMVKYGPFDGGNLPGLVAVTRAALDRS